jgi:cobalt/nickel transport protein
MNAARSRFLLGFLLAALVIAGGLSYLASPDPDGLDASPCTAARSPRPPRASSSTAPASPSTPRHPMAAGPLADYAVGGHAGTTGLAGIVGSW